MALLDFLTGGDKPQRRGPTAAESRLIGATDRLQGELGGLSAISNRYADSLVRGRPGERARFLGAGGANVQQAFASPVTNTNQAVENTLRRGRGLTRIAQSRANEFDSQLLRDRVAFTRGVTARRGRGLGALAGAAGGAEAGARAEHQTSLTSDAIRANTLGTIAGLGAGFAHNRDMFGRRKRQGDTGITYDSTARTTDYSGTA